MINLIEMYWYHLLNVIPQRCVNRISYHNMNILGVEALEVPEEKIKVHQYEIFL